MPSALGDVVVLDLSRVLAGPLCTMVLADLGADVIKVEHPRGDDTRRWGPPFHGDDAAYFHAVNRNKRSLCLDLKHPEGRRIVRQLACQSDVVVHNFRPESARRLGVDAASLRGLEPRLVVAEISGFGRDGPAAARPGYDLLMQAMGGLMSITGPPEGPPSKVGVAVVDVVTGLFAANGILAALHERERSGEGQSLDLSLFDCSVAALVNQAQNYFATGSPPARHGNAHPNLTPYEPYRAEDGWIVVAVGNDEQLARLADAVGQPALATDPRFATNAARVEHRAALGAALAPAFATRSVAAWCQLLEERGVPAGPIRDLGGVMADPQLAHRGMIAEVGHPAGPLRLLASPLHLDRTPPTIRRPPPGLGEHTREVLQERLDLDHAAFSALAAAGAIPR